MQLVPFVLSFLKFWVWQQLIENWKPLAGSVLIEGIITSTINITVSLRFIFWGLNQTQHRASQPDLFWPGKLGKYLSWLWPYSNKVCMLWSHPHAPSIGAYQHIAHEEPPFMQVVMESSTRAKCSFCSYKNRIESHPSR